MDDVKQVAPPNSYIHAEMFSSQEELLGYLDFLDNNDEAYLEYHQWRSLFPPGKRNPVLQSMGPNDSSICELCRVIRDMRSKRQRQIIHSVCP